ncbi:MAG: leucine-rich repeat protein, partial [Muribaculaceae bacterium]|nr:leucine-rich repeat protein [Muribaculaceae bacterium]
LMKDAGEAVYMAYGPMESGANMNWVGHRMQQVFKYSPDCQFITKQNFKDEEWLDLLKKNVDSGNPVIYQGTDKDVTMNHAFIVDGYNSDGYHINWGWDGWFNGYYALDALTPNDSQDFSCNNGMVINMVPDKSGREYSECFTDYGYFWIGAGAGTPMNISVENVKTGEPFHLINSLINLPKGFEGMIGLALVDQDGKIKEVLQSYNVSTYSSTDMEYLDMGMASNFSDVIATVNIDPTDRLQLVTKNNKDAEYRLVLGTLEWPSSIAVIKNTPRYGKVKVEIGENVDFNYNFGPFGNENQHLLPGKTELTSLLGSTVFFTAKVENPEPDELVVVSLKGKAVFGIGNFAGEFINYSIDVSEDCELTAKAVKLSNSSVNLATAGTLKDKLPAEEALTVKNLTITGKMNAKDFWYIRDNCPSIHYLDIKTVDIEAVEAADGEFNVEPVDNPEKVIPEGALVSLERLEELILPDNLVGIADNSLMGLGLKKISIPAGVKYIGLNAFHGNVNLEAVEMLNPEPFAINDCVFNNTPYSTRSILFVPKESAKLYTEVEDWKNFHRIVEGDMPGNVLADLVKDGIRYHCLYDEAYVSGYEGEPKEGTLADVVSVDGNSLPVVKVDSYAFNDCTSIESIVLSKNIVEIGERSFCGCMNLKKVLLNEGIKKIGREAFYQAQGLEECELPDGLEELGMCAFQNNNLKKVVIPKNAAPATDLRVFANCMNLDKFEVAEGNKFFKVIDGILYRIVENGLILESVPGLKSGEIVLPDDCIKVWDNSIWLSSNEPCTLIFNPQLEIIESDALNAINVREIVLPNNAFIYPNALFGTEGLETLVFTGKLKSSDGIINQAGSLKNIIIESSDEIEIDGVFANAPESINIFTSSPEKNFSYSGECVVYVPGQCADKYALTRAAEVREMWRYNANRKEGKMEIVPQIEDLEIDKVTINGKTVKPTDDIYPIEGNTNLDVKVEYTL